MIKLLFILFFPFFCLGQERDSVFIKNIIGYKKSMKNTLTIDSIFTVVDDKPMAFETKTDSFYVYNGYGEDITYFETTTFLLPRSCMYYNNLGTDSTIFCCFWIKINKKIFPIYYETATNYLKGNKLHIEVTKRGVLNNRVRFEISNGGPPYFMGYVKSIKRVGDIVEYKPIFSPAPVRGY